jgi:hypothetical protein
VGVYVHGGSRSPVFILRTHYIILLFHWKIISRPRTNRSITSPLLHLANLAFSHNKLLRYELLRSLYNMKKIYVSVQLVRDDTTMTDITGVWLLARHSPTIMDM